MPLIYIFPCRYGYLISYCRLEETGVKAEEWGPVMYCLLRVEKKKNRKRNITGASVHCCESAGCDYGRGGWCEQQANHGHLHEIVPQNNLPTTTVVSTSKCQQWCRQMAGKMAVMVFHSCNSHLKMQQCQNLKIYCVYAACFCLKMNRSVVWIPQYL